MIDHTGISVSDLERSKTFYTQALAPLNYTLLRVFPGVASFGAPRPGPGEDPGGAFWLAEGTVHEPRSHIAFSAGSREQVDAFHKAALAAGATDNGAPGLRPQYHADYYAAFVRDPDGYNIEAVCHVAP